MALQLTCKIVMSIFSILKNAIEVNILKVISKEITEQQVWTSY